MLSLEVEGASDTLVLLHALSDSSRGLVSGSNCLPLGLFMHQSNGPSGTYFISQGRRRGKD